MSRTDASTDPIGAVKASPTSGREERSRSMEGITYEAFLARSDETPHAEWVDGQVEVMSPASRVHQRIILFLSTVLGPYVEERGLGQVFLSPFQMKTGPDLPGREPDLLFVARENESRIHANHLEGPADLAVEVVSPESRLRDRGAKLAEYEMGGVREYWLIDPDELRADVYVLGPDRRFERRRAGSDGALHSVAIQGFWIRELWLWEDPPPRALLVLRELGIR